MTRDPLLHVEVSGTGEPTILLMHGFAGSARNLRPQARFLEEVRHRVVLFDARGHARSEAPLDPNEYEPEAFVEDVRRVLAQVGGATSVVVGGVSMGAAIALRYALRYPADVRGLVLASFPPAGNSTRWALDLAESIDRDGLEIAGEKFVWSDARFDREAARWIRQGFLEHSAHALSAVLKRVLSIQPAVVDLKKDLALLRVPTLVIVGSNDERSLEPSRDLSLLIPGAHLVVVDGAGHTVNLEKPESFNGALNDFLTEFES